MNTKNLVGSKYGKLTVIDIAPRGKGGQARWECKCACGETRKVEEYALKKGLVVSCGCYKREMQTKHNMSRTKIYKVWAAMKQRCGNENDKSYNNYGGRGITVCDEWREDFQAFYDWATANGYKEGLQIDRIDNDGDYEPGNCQWTTKKINLRNKRQSVFIEYNNEVHTVAEWSRITGIHRNTLDGRIRSGKPVEEIFKPVINRRIGGE